MNINSRTNQLSGVDAGGASRLNFEAADYECCYPHGREKAEAETALAALWAR